MNPCRIGVVEDEAIVAMDIEDRLTAMGYELAGRAVSGKQALELVEKQHPDLILMDVRLRGGDMDGIEAAEEIRRRFHLPLIFLTAYSEDATLDRAKLAEPYGYILKPFDDRELKSAIEIALYKHQAEKEIRRLNRLYDVLSQTNQTVVRARSRDELLQTVCRLVVERGAIDLAWIGWLDPSTTHIRTVVSFGSGSELLEDAKFTADDQPEGQGTPGRAIREGKPAICNACTGNDCLYPSMYSPGRFGFQSCGSFPIHFQGRVCGALTLCVKEQGFFRKRETELLQEVALDVSFALDKIEGEARRRQVEAALRESEEQLRLFIEHAPAALAMFDLDMRYLSVSHRWLSDYNLGDRDLIGRSHYEVFPEIPERWKTVHRRALAGEVVKAESDRFERADGAVQWQHWEVRPWRDQKGDIAGIVIFSEDITEQKKAESSLRKSEERFRQAMEATSDGLWDWDVANNSVYFSPGYYRMLGYEPGEFSAEVDTWLELVHSDDRERAMAANEACIRNDTPSVNVEFRMRARDGTWRWIMGRGKAVRRDGGGRALQMIGTHVDITERKQAEEEKTRTEAQLRQAQKMEALGTLAGGIAHDFNNILGIIIGYTELALTSPKGKGPPSSGLEEVLKAAGRAKDLVKQILAFSRLNDQEKKPVQVGLIVKEVMKMLRASLPSTIEIELNVASKAAMLCDPTQIHQVLMNLCTNAAHAMRDQGGVLKVSLTDTRLESESIPPHSALIPGPYLELSVMDTGHGIDPSILERIFDPFFTTKEQGVGTGLGLSVVHGIVKSHGGAIEVESLPGGGTTFRLLLPALESAQMSDEVDLEPLPHGRERILVVDDEPSLAHATMQMLERLGYEVECRMSGTEALEIFRNLAGKPFDLVITDMTMPQLTGADLARELLNLQPDLSVLLSTGFNDKIDAEKAESLGIKGVLMKPVAVRELAGLVRKVLDERAD